MKRSTLAAMVAALAGFALAGCQHDPRPQDPMAQTEASLVSANTQAGHAFGPEISAEDFSAHIRVLASDAFGGRQPGSDGEVESLALTCGNRMAALRSRRRATVRLPW